MTERPCLPAMIIANHHPAMLAQDAAECLLALGWPVRPAEDDLDMWRIGDFELTDEELIGLATRRGIWPAVKRVQYEAAASRVASMLQTTDRKMLYTHA